MMGQVFVKEEEKRDHGRVKMKYVVGNKIGRGWEKMREKDT